ncbi:MULTISPECIES: amidase [Sorangium]|uniref:Amidase n=1 Tax=Sorangium cellulosum TaxID=56 RepID=A0A4P2QF54_SORCE|nr:MULTISPECIES: amidase [Sorangium]AUX28058.1 amidase [Sorangium cellulosum]WCQ87462.1 Glutamyl-tRNA(Gln) amidotransferase subunit A [Sorangium sp. Soce836]
MKVPRLTGRALTAARLAAEAPGSSAALRKVLKRALGIDRLSSLPDAWRDDIPAQARPIQAAAPRRWGDAALGALPRRDWPRTSLAYAAAYRHGAVDPRRVAERALSEIDALAAQRPCMNIAVAAAREAALRDAYAAAARHAAGRARGPLDGVPFLVKDEFDVEGLPTTLGSRCGPLEPAPRDAAVVARLRQAGAVLLCKTVLTEWGMSPLGNNVHQRMPHNPHHSERAAGGSSTGSAVGVALGLAPLAAGGDGGGSIRTPAALNGIFGLKPTFGRVSRAGDGFKGSVAHAGPIACSAADLALFLDAVASEPDPDDDLTAWAPPPPPGGFGALLGAGVRGLRIGVDEAEWRDASVPIASACRGALRALEREGAVLVDVQIPIARYAAQIGYLVIGPESLEAHQRAFREQRDLISEDLRVTFSVLSGVTARERRDAARLRAGMRREVARALAGVDVLALPTTAITAPRYQQAEEGRAFLDPAALEGVCRFAFLANLTGLPAGTAPVGIDAERLPIGLQIIGDAWDEAAVLAVLAHLERSELAVAPRPPGGIDLLG